jgi:hypothetical protein
MMDELGMKLVSFDLRRHGGYSRIEEVYIIKFCEFLMYSVRRDLHIQGEVGRKEIRFGRPVTGFEGEPLAQSILFRPRTYLFKRFIFMVNICNNFTKLITLVLFM